MSGPSLRRRQLGAALRELRMARGISVLEAARQTSLSTPTVSRIENGVRRVRPVDVRVLLAAYGVDLAEAGRYLELAEEADRPGWWERAHPTVSQAGAYQLEMESTATELRSWHPELLPPLAQTDGYLRAVRTAALPELSAEELDEAVRLGRTRREALSDNGTRLISVVGEGALRRLVGGAREMRDQLDWLLVAGQQPEFSIRVLPFHSGAHPAMESAFTLLGFDDVPGRSAVWLESDRVAQVVEHPEDVEHYAATFDLLSWSALSEADSARLIDSIAAGLR
ncbi:MULTISPECIES: helix-turn-helix domain-containing protein [Actinoalloteichus]|uniref:Transcriptional regulator n=1 Tax=Actinoalloteichus fjordicus TaxID=1612552 RepID=A0AAC9LAH4_9PSEU|nr:MULTISPECIES: helix-turn-helix transcriptional regulator [Actinoalloteichus]APU13996.1 putative transcriptional regulator [Actinoalloteichus fjordicus]APU19942.1 putative transcriptional regulator [Actinoalloteichus sp. GBA129-24]